LLDNFKKLESVTSLFNMVLKTESIKQSREYQDITELFSTVGIDIPKKVKIFKKSGVTYDFEQKIEDNWIYATLCGFQELNKKFKLERRACKHFITVGTGPGIDALGAHYIFHPDFIRVTDINKEAAKIALKNLRSNLLQESQVISACSFGNLLEVDLDEWGIPTKASPIDLIYANLPNIPIKNVDVTSSKAATYINEELLLDCPNTLKHNLLGLQYAFLQQAEKKLTRGGSTVIAFGLRIPYEEVMRLFALVGLKLEELFANFKIQTQPEEVISGYSLAEKKFGKIFTFYDYDGVIGSGLLGQCRGGEQMQRKLLPFALTSQQALTAYHEGKRLGHIVAILRGLKE